MYDSDQDSEFEDENMEAIYSPDEESIYSKVSLFWHI